MRRKANFETSQSPEELEKLYSIFSTLSTGLIAPSATTKPAESKGK